MLTPALAARNAIAWFPPVSGGLEHKDCDAPVRGSALVLVKAGIYAETLLPDLRPTLVVRLDRAHAPVHPINHDLSVRMCA
jgi:hypothetical protein